MSTASSVRDALVWRGETAVARAQLLREAAGLAALLPGGEFIMNLCEQRENFLLLFAAAALAGRTQLMPAARGDAALAELGMQYPEAIRIGDEELKTLRASAIPAAEVPEPAPDDPDRLLMVGFTSGSTGKSQPHPKRWRALAG
jgi:acyl-coenzyme A synthetase/AMP-(fatty) acid ligase